MKKKYCTYEKEGRPFMWDGLPQLLQRNH